jgi:hypothetical protein
MSETAEQRLARSLFLVEANTFEQNVFWQQHAHNSWLRPAGYEVLRWEQISDGRMVTIGKLDKRPLTIEFYWVKIEGQLICFYNECSQVRDSVRTEKWLKKHFKGTYDNGHRRAVTDSNNFGQCISAIKEANAEPNSVKILTKKA